MSLTGASTVQLEGSASNIIVSASGASRVKLAAFPVNNSLFAAPIYYSFVDINRILWNIDTLWEALLLTLIGIPLVFISLHLMNGMAIMSGRLARVMLETKAD